MADKPIEELIDKSVETSFPEYLLKLAEGCSTYAKVASKYWVACALVSIVTLSAKSTSDTTVKLPFDLPELDKTEFYPFAFVVIGVLLIAFGSATSQAIRARQLINRVIYRQESKIIFNGDVYLQDILDVVLYPAINRVAPLAQVLQGKKQFFPEAEKLSRIQRYSALIYYVLLKLAATFVVYGLPGYAMLSSFQYSNNHLGRLWNIPFAFFWVLGIFSLVTLSTLVGMDLKYTWNVIIKLANRSKKK